MQTVDIAIIGGGIVGLATAYQLNAAQPALRLAVLEKEAALASHQTGHNSGVLHSGIYYKPGSLKATNCRLGKLAMEAFCREQGIAHDVCGKVIVAVEDRELPLLKNIYERGLANQVRCQMIDRAQLRELEPASAGVAAIHVPEAGIVNYLQVAQRMADLIVASGQSVACETRVQRWLRDATHTVLETSRESYRARLVVNCAGLHCDRVMRQAGDRPAARIVPFRGEYYELTGDATSLCRNLIYPVPDPKFPFLGVHFTRMIDGGVECGPNAVLAFAREGYSKWRVNPRDLWESLSYRGFQRMAWRHWKQGCGEMWRSLSKGAFVRALQRLLPAIQSSQLRAAPAGVRAQAVTWEGALVDDFLIVETKHAIHVNNAPSPAATASLNIGRTIADRAIAKLA